MKKVEVLYIQDMAKAPFVDRFFYQLLNSLNGVSIDCEFLYLNPLKWSLMTLVNFNYYLIVFIVYLVIALPVSAYYAVKMKGRYKGEEWKGCHECNVKILRDLK